MMGSTEFGVYYGKIITAEKRNQTIDAEQIPVLRKVVKNFLIELARTTGAVSVVLGTDEVADILDHANKILRSNGYNIYIPNALKPKVQNDFEIPKPKKEDMFNTIDYSNENYNQMEKNIKKELKYKTRKIEPIAEYNIKHQDEGKVETYINKYYVNQVVETKTDEERKITHFIVNPQKIEEEV